MKHSFLYLLLHNKDMVKVASHRKISFFFRNTSPFATFLFIWKHITKTKLMPVFNFHKERLFLITSTQFYLKFYEKKKQFPLYMQSGTKKSSLVSE